MSLQPYRTFTNETTRLNKLYWGSRYALRTLRALHTAKASGMPEPTRNEQKNIRDGLPGIGGLRVAAVLAICSAFERTTSAYFTLCILYKPREFAKTRRFRAVPDILVDPNAFRALSEQAQRTSAGEMNAKYSERLTKFHAKFRLDMSWAKKDWGSSLDDFQKVRHTIAHDQSLDGADDPTLSSSETLRRATKVSETDWKEMLGLFRKTIKRLDSLVSRNIVTDGGCALASFRILERSSAVSFSDMCEAIQHEWRIPSQFATGPFIRNVISGIGYQVDAHGVIRAVRR